MLFSACVLICVGLWPLCLLVSWLSDQLTSTYIKIVTPDITPLHLDIKCTGG
jgi:hypothetical protein